MDSISLLVKDKIRLSTVLIPHRKNRVPRPKKVFKTVPNQACSLSNILVSEGNFRRIYFLPPYENLDEIFFVIDFNEFYEVVCS